MRVKFLNFILVASLVASMTVLGACEKNSEESEGAKKRGYRNNSQGTTYYNRRHRRWKKSNHRKLKNRHRKRLKRHH